ncbi:MAG: DUF4134 domain-containing protein [Sphingobacterium sp.]
MHKEILEQESTLLLPRLLIMIIGGVVGMIGAFRVYQKWNSGDQDINKELMGWGGSALFLVVAPIVIKAVFGI